MVQSFLGKKRGRGERGAYHNVSGKFSISRTSNELKKREEKA